MMNALDRCTLYSPTLNGLVDWAASGAGITGTLAAFFIRPDNNYHDSRDAPGPRYS